MPTVVQCPNCARSMRVADGVPGRRVKCPQCQTIFALSNPPAAPKPAAPKPAAKPKADAGFEVLDDDEVEQTAPQRPAAKAPERRASDAFANLDTPAARQRPLRDDNDDDNDDGDDESDDDSPAPRKRVSTTGPYPHSYGLVNIAIILNLVFAFGMVASTLLGMGLSCLIGPLAGIAFVPVMLAQLASFSFHLAAPIHSDARRMAWVTFILVCVYFTMIVLPLTVFLAVPQVLIMGGLPLVIALGIYNLLTVAVGIAHGFAHLLTLRNESRAVKAKQAAEGFGFLIVLSAWTLGGGFLSYLLMLGLGYAMLMGGGGQTGAIVWMILFVMWVLAFAGMNIWLLALYIINLFRLRGRVSQARQRERK